MSETVKTNESLAQQLNVYKQGFLQKADQDKIQTYEDGIKAVLESGILEKALKVGDQAISFELNNATGQSVSLQEYLQKGPVILTWYRGGWCPYCNLTLRALQQKLPEFQAAGANLLTLTPELPDNSLATSEKHNLQFEVLTDLNSEVAQKYGLVFQLTPEVAKYYDASFNMEAYNGNDKKELPLAATYVIDSSGKIQYAYLNADYRERAEPGDILEAVKSLN